MRMTCRERVRAALTWRRPDRVPVGEFELSALEPALARAGARPDSVGVVVGRPGWKDRLVRLAGPDGGGAFVWAVVDGPFQGLAAERGLEGALLATLRSGRAERAALFRDGAARAAAQAREALALGADGVVVGEDVAYGGGLMLPWDLVAGELAPLWAELAEAAMGWGSKGLGSGAAGAVRPLVALHCDSATVGLMDVAAQAGFDAFHPLEPGSAAAAGAGWPGRVERYGDRLDRYRGRLGLWGGLPLDLLARGEAAQVEALARRLGDLGREGGLVVGTTSGEVPAWVPAERLAGAYAAVASGAAPT
ncbi:MAG: hypothetical protein K6U08_03760 [Firmicutes bacterium]|nr:hypothetical protein [Bacillota bacterium]